MKKMSTPWEGYMAVEYMGAAWTVLKYKDPKGGWEILPCLMAAPLEDGEYNIATSDDSWVDVEDLTDYSEKELEGLNKILARE